MKKTMIAMAVAGVVAAPMASADVTIGGKVEQGFTITDSTTASLDQMTGFTDAVLTFKASEDLGNGMTAKAEQRLDFDGASGVLGLTDTKVSLAGGFGTVVAGRMEAFSEAKIMSMVDVFGGHAEIEPENDSAGRTDDGIAYVSPAMNGFTLGLAGYATGSADADDLDVQEVALMYANGPLAVNLSSTDANATAQTSLTIGDAVSAGIKYTAGDLAVSAVWQDIEDEGSIVTNDNENWGVAAVYTMGNNSIALGTVENENQAGSSTDSISSVEFRHKFSGRTRAYVGGTFDDYNTATSDSDTVYFGMEHSF